MFKKRKVPPDALRPLPFLIVRLLWVSSNANYDTYRVTTTTTPYDFDMYITGGDAFSAIVPHATTSFASDSRGRTLMGGLGISGRASAFSYDAFAEYGQLGVNGAWSIAP